MKRELISVPMLPQDLGAALSDALANAVSAHQDAHVHQKHFHAGPVTECSYPDRCGGMDPFAVIYALTSSAARTARLVDASERPACVHATDGKCERCGAFGYMGPLERTYRELRAIVPGARAL